MEKAKRKKDSFNDFVVSTYPNIFKQSNIDFPVDNLIVGLIKNMLRKNLMYAKEDFMEYNKYFFKVVLDASGFEREIILEALSELSFNAQKFYKDGILFSSQIQDILYNETEQLITLNIEKQKLLALRELILKSKES
jgi:hypothetical protein